MPYRRTDRGLTLIELLVVITILGFLATITTIKVFDIVEEGRVTKTKTDIGALKDALSIYKLENKRYPTSAEGLEVLAAPSDKHADGLIGSYSGLDAWDNPFEYTSDGRKYRIVSLGADGMEGGDGFDADITSDDIGSNDSR